MADQKRKIETIRSIEQMQLPQNLIAALDNAAEAQNIADAIQYLAEMSDQWN
ncbi:hypothetical protein [Acinetobacter tianfuensis]|uniref:hypothetical protein n=1 Tax=Acinetobacter tianfuensis TaxID=2419603 RepID=UPI00148C34D6|nr:hypothetical protein [Acinetobacter tianfuensis]